MTLFYQGFSDEDIIEQLGINEETLSLIKERQQRMMDRAKEMSTMYGRPLPQQVLTTGAPTPGVTTPSVTTPSVPIPPRPVTPVRRTRTRVFFRKKQVVMFLIGLTLAAIGSSIMGIMCIPYTFWWWLIILEMIAANIVFQIIFGIVAFGVKFRSRTYTGVAAADYDGDGQYDEVAIAKKTVSGTTVKWKVLFFMLFIFGSVTYAIFSQFGIGIEGFNIFGSTPTRISLGGDVFATSVIFYAIGVLIGGYGLTR